MNRFAKRITRREWTALLGALPLAAQTPPPAAADSALPPSGPTPLTTSADLQKAYDGVRRISDRLQKIDVPMDVEPAFSFKA